MDNIQTNINKLKNSASLIQNNYSILYKNSSFLNDNIEFDNDTKKLFRIHFLNKNKYSMCDIYELYLNYLNDKNLIDEDYINLDSSIKQNLNINENTIFLKDLFSYIKIKFNKNN